MFLAVLLVGLFALSAVSATDSPTGDIVGVYDNNVLSADEQSFAQLNATINANNDENIYLNNDYKYSSDDFSFKEGIVINRDVTVYGNGHTIDGSGEARIFHVTGGNVVFYNINFINGYNDDWEYGGGAIYGSGKAISCTFENNTAHYGGAMLGGSAENCNFVENFAESQGGAMFGGSAVDCTFSGNSANFVGGAMLRGSAVNCTFSGNSAQYGGAMDSSSALNCLFSENSGQFGGAMYSSSARDCTFSKNSADDGGAMGGGSAINCTFSENYAKEFGGAIYSCDARDCTFSDNLAESDGGAIYVGSAVNCKFIRNLAGNRAGAMYEGAAVDCTFDGNYANNEGNDLYHTFKWNCIGKVASEFYESKDLVSHWGVNDFISTYNSGDTLQINIRDQFSDPVNLIDVDVVVYENGVAIRTYHCLSGDKLSFDLAPGNYVAELIVAYPRLNQPNPINISLTINKAVPKIDVAASNVVYPNSVAVTVKADVDGKYNIKIGSTSKVVDLKKGVAKKVIFTGLAPKKYTATVKFTGNENYADKVINIDFTVKKATPKLTASKKTFKKSVKIKQYVVTLKTNKNKVMKNTWVTLKVNKKTYKVKTNKKGQATFKITNLNKKGTFKAVVKYDGSKYYSAKTVKPKIVVK